MTSLSALRDAGKMAEGESPTLVEIRLAEVKEAFVEGEITEHEFEELLDASFEEGPPYLAEIIIEDEHTYGIPTPEDVDEEIYRNRGTFYTIDGNLARERKPPEWETVFNVLEGEEQVSRGPDEVKNVDPRGEPSEEAKERQEELKDRITLG